MRYLSVCSGIEAATVAWHGLGWQPVGFSEIEKFPSQVLAHHYPSVPNVGDMNNYKEWDIGAIDLLVGGTPCQSFSVAGLRKGLEDPRGNLALVYCGILDHFRPQWFVWENVPGVLSSGGGRDFGSFLGALAELGYGFAYRVLDAQYFGVAQRRRRVFVVGHLGDWRPAAAVLFESESLRRDTAPSREKRKDPAKSLMASPSQRLDPTLETMIPIGVPEVMSTLLSSTAGISRPGNAATEHETYIPMAVCLGGQHPNASIDTERSPTLTNAMGAGGGHVPLVNQPIAIQDTRPIEKAQNGRGWNDDGTAYTVDTHATQGVAQPVGAFNIAPGKGALKDDIHITDATVTKTLDASGSNPAMHQGGAAIVQSMAVAQPIAPALTASNDPSRSPQSSEVTQQVAAVHAASMAVRRLTPVECERLQGFPDNYTAIPWRGKAETPDGPRYKALGNSMAVPVMKWIGGRINGKR
jgi:DNA (cytosine-5)-methyltransferase 1